MKFFIDTANIDEIKQAVDMGMVDGVTTNPSLIAREGRVFEEVLVEICSIVDGPISAEVVSLEAEGMVAEGKKLAAINDNIVIKVPMTTDGIKAVRMFAADGIKTNVTLVFSASQALLAAKAGAAFISPFVGRLDDISLNGMDLISDIMAINENYGFTSEVIVASIRSPVHVVESTARAAAG